MCSSRREDRVGEKKVGEKMKKCYVRLFILSLHAWYLDDGTIIGDTAVVGNVLELIMKDGSGPGLHINVDKTKVFWPKEDPQSILTAKTIRLMDAIAKINDPQCELFLLRSCTSISRLYITMRTCPPCFFESAQRSFDMALRSSLECIVTASGPGFGDWQWRLATLPFAFRRLGVYSVGETMNGKTYCCVLCYQLGIPLFSGLKPCSACSKVFAGDIYGDYAVSCAGIIGIKHRHNAMRDTLVDICYHFEISVGLDVCVDLIGSSPLTQTRMVYFIPGRAVIDVAQRKREADDVTLPKRIRKFSITQDIRACAAIHIFNRISFAIAKGVAAQIVSRLSSNFL
nr:hypothetical protein [Tanacetum cinerariifolium]